MHLTKFEHAIVSGGEWRVRSDDWLVLHLCGGFAYALDSRAGQESPLDGIILCPPKSEVKLVASVLGRAVFRGVVICIRSMGVFLTALERRCLETEVARKFAPFRRVPSQHPPATRLTEVLKSDGAMTLASRLGCAEAFADLVKSELLLVLHNSKETDNNHLAAKGRLRQILENAPKSDISNLSLGQLAKILRCSERHTTRLFREERGMSFLNYVSERRLKKACDLLLQGGLRIIDVALESRHGSPTHFHYVFKKKFHMTPTAWRKQRTSQEPLT